MLFPPFFFLRCHSLICPFWEHEKVIWKLNMVLQFSDLFRSILPIKAWRGGEFGGEWGEMKSLSCVQFFVTPWTVAHQAPLSMVFFRQGYWSGLPFPSPGDLPDPEIKPGSPALQADSLLSETPGKPPCKNTAKFSRDYGIYDTVTHWMKKQVWGFSPGLLIQLLNKVAKT